MNMSCRIVFGFLLAPCIAFSQAGKPDAAPLEQQIAYRFSFDKESNEPDVGTAEIKPTVSQEYASGRHGKAMVVSGTEPTAFTLEKHIWSDEGALTLWVAPSSWTSPESVTSRGIIVFLRLPLGGNGKFILERQGFDSGTNRQDYLLAGIFGIEDFKEDILLVLGSTLDWENDKWHFIAINWDKTSFSISLDGRAFKTAKLPRAFTSSECPADIPSTLQVGYNMEASDEKTLLDELTIYKKPLTIEEVRSLMGDDSEE